MGKGGESRFFFHFVLASSLLKAVQIVSPSQGARYDPGGMNILSHCLQMDLDDV